MTKPTLWANTIAFLILGGMFFAHPAQATTYTFTGLRSTQFGTPLNWLPMGIPQNGDSIVVNGNSTVDLSTNITLTSVILRAGSTLTGTGNLTVTNALSCQSSVFDGIGTLTLGPQSVSDFGISLLNILASPNNRTRKKIFNSGVVNVSSGDLVLFSDFVNEAGGSINLQCDGSITGAIRTFPILRNKGSVTKAAGTGTSSVDTTFINTGVVRSMSGTLGVGPSYTQTDGLTSLDGGNLAAGGTINILGGKLAGGGLITGDVVNDSSGHVAPGHSPGSITINGNYTQTGNGSLDIEIGGTQQGTQYDNLTVNGTATLNGMLNIVQYGDYFPVAGSNFEILDYYSNAGNFSTVNFQFPGSTLAFGTTLSPIYLIVTASKPDATRPKANVTTPASNAVSTAFPTASGKAAAAGSSVIQGVSVQLYRYGNATTEAGFWGGGSNWNGVYNAATNEVAAGGTTDWSVSLPALAYGEYSLRPTAKDNVGKTSLSNSVHFYKTTGKSTIAASTTVANAAAHTIKIKMTGALDTKYATDSSGYDVTRATNGSALSIQTVSYDASSNTVILNFVSGAIQAGDKVSVIINRMFDSTGKILNKQTCTATAN